MSDGWTSEGKRIMRELDKLQELLVKVGFQDGQKYPDGTMVVDVAAWNELGTVNMPSRPFMRDSVDENEEKIVKFLQAKAVDIIKNGKTAEQVLKEVGVFQKGIIQDTIVSGSFKPNSPATIAKKGSSKPLIDTGIMRNSVNFIIKKRGV